MKILPKHGSRKSIFRKLIVIDADGESMAFDSAKKVAQFLGVNISRIYAALKSESKVRGCIVKSERE